MLHTAGPYRLRLTITHRYFLVTTDPRLAGPRATSHPSFDTPRRFTAARRLQSGFAVVALVVVGAGAHRAGWLGADALAPERTLQTARVPVAAVRATASVAAADLDPGTSRRALRADALTRGTATPAPAEAAILTAPTPAPASSRAADAAEGTATADADASASAERGTAFATGVASYYGSELAGRRTASGERFNPNAMTAAHRTLPLGTRLRVTNSANGKSVVVRVNDRGPFARGRILDLSHAAARVIGLVSRGHGSVSIERLGRRLPRRTRCPDRR